MEQIISKKLTKHARSLGGSYVGEIRMGKPLFSLDLSECPAMNATGRLGRVGRRASRELWSLINDDVWMKISFLLDV